MAYVAVLDADVLHPHVCCDLLLGLADRGLFRPVWSQAIIEELRSSLVKRGLSAQKVDWRINQMTTEFREAMVDGVERYACVVLDAADPDDAHVVAAALAARADGIVTQNVRDFRTNELAAIGIELQSFDEFLLNQWTLAPQVVLDVLREMEAHRNRPPKTVDELLNALQQPAPGFVTAVRAGMTS